MKIAKTILVLSILPLAAILLWGELKSIQAPAVQELSYGEKHHDMEASQLELESMQENGRVLLSIESASLQDGKIGFFRTGAAKLLVLKGVKVACYPNTPGASVGKMLKTAFAKAGVPVEKLEKIMFEVKIDGIDIEIAKLNGEQITISAETAKWRSADMIEMNNARLKTMSNNLYFKDYDLSLVSALPQI